MKKFKMTILLIVIFCAAAIYMGYFFGTRIRYNVTQKNLLQKETPPLSPQPEIQDQPIPQSTPEQSLSEKRHKLQIDFLEALIDGEITRAREILIKLEETGISHNHINDYKKDLDITREKLPDQCYALVKMGLFKQAEAVLKEITVEPDQSGLKKMLDRDRNFWFMRNHQQVAQMHKKGEYAAVKCYTDELAECYPENPIAVKLGAEVADFIFEKNDSKPGQIMLRSGTVALNYYHAKGTLRCGADPNAILGNMSALHWLIFRMNSRKHFLKQSTNNYMPLNQTICSFMKIVDVLLEYGASPSLVMQEGQHAGSCALSFAIDLDFYPLLKYLARHGGKPDAAGFQSRITMIQKAIENEDRNMIKYLRLKGARVPPEIIQQVYSPEILDILKSPVISQ